MRRLMLEMSQTQLADGLGLTFAGSVFFYGQPGATVEIADSHSTRTNSLAKSDGVALVKAFMRFQYPKLRRK